MIFSAKSLWSLSTKEFPSPTGENFFESVFSIFYGGKILKKRSLANI
jgi:hypothetical protein